MDKQEAEKAAPQSAKNVSVIELFNHSWAVIKKNFKELAIITLIGVAINVAISALLVFAVINIFLENTEGAVLTVIIGGAVAVLGSVFTGLFQVVALKKAIEGKKIIPGEIIKESWTFVPIVLRYAFALLGVLLLSGFIAGILTSIFAPLGALFGFALLVAFIIALFRYAFVQFIIIEPKSFRFMERFTISEKLTNGIYSTLIMVWLVSIGLGIGAGITSSILSSPFNESASNKISNTSYDFSDAESFDDLRRDVRKATKEAVQESFSVKYVIKEVITQAITWGVGLVVLGALLELYNMRKKEVTI